MNKLVVVPNARGRYDVRLGENGPIVLSSLSKEVSARVLDCLVIFDEPITAHIMQSHRPIRISVVGRRPSTEQVFYSPTENGELQWADTEDVIWHYPEVVVELERLRNIDKQIVGLQFLRGEAILGIMKKSEENMPTAIVSGL